MKQETKQVDVKACCAHLNVLYEKGVCDGKNIRGEVVPNGGAYDIWKCRDCGTRFTPIAALSDAQQIVKEYEEFEKTCVELDGYLAGFVKEHPKRPGMQELFPRFSRQLIALVQKRLGIHKPSVQAIIRGGK